MERSSLWRVSLILSLLSGLQTERDELLLLGFVIVLDELLGVPLKREANSLCILLMTSLYSLEHTKMK